MVAIADDFVDFDGAENIGNTPPRPRAFFGRSLGLRFGSGEDSGEGQNADGESGGDSISNPPQGWVQII